MTLYLTCGQDERCDYNYGFIRFDNTTLLFSTWNRTRICILENRTLATVPEALKSKPGQYSSLPVIDSISIWIIISYTIIVCDVLYVDINSTSMYVQHVRTFNIYADDTEVHSDCCGNILFTGHIVLWIRTYM